MAQRTLTVLTTKLRATEKGLRELPRNLFRNQLVTQNKFTYQSDVTLIADTDWEVAIIRCF